MIQNQSLINQEDSNILDLQKNTTEENNDICINADTNFIQNNDLNILISQQNSQKSNLENLQENSQNNQNTTQKQNDTTENQKDNNTNQLQKSSSDFKIEINQSEFQMEIEIDEKCQNNACIQLNDQNSQENQNLILNYQQDSELFDKIQQNIKYSEIENKETNKNLKNIQNNEQQQQQQLNTQNDQDNLNIIQDQDLEIDFINNNQQINNNNNKNDIQEQDLDIDFINNNQQINNSNNIIQDNFEEKQFDLNKFINNNQSNMLQQEQEQIQVDNLLNQDIQDNKSIFDNKNENINNNQNEFMFNLNKTDQEKFQTCTQKNSTVEIDLNKNFSTNQKNLNQKSEDLFNNNNQQNYSQQQSQKSYKSCKKSKKNNAQNIEQDKFQQTSSKYTYSSKKSESKSKKQEKYDNKNQIKNQKIYQEIEELFPSNCLDSYYLFGKEGYYMEEYIKSLGTLNYKQLNKNLKETRKQLFNTPDESYDTEDIELFIIQEQKDNFYQKYQDQANQDSKNSSENDNQIPEFNVVQEFIKFQNQQAIKKQSQYQLQQSYQNTTYDNFYQPQYAYTPQQIVQIQQNICQSQQNVKEKKEKISEAEKIEKKENKIKKYKEWKLQYENKTREQLEQIFVEDYVNKQILNSMEFKFISTFIFVKYLDLYKELEIRYQDQSFVKDIYFQRKKIDSKLIEQICREETQKQTLSSEEQN